MDDYKTIRVPHDISLKLIQEFALKAGCRAYYHDGGILLKRQTSNVRVFPHKPRFVDDDKIHQEDE